MTPVRDRIGASLKSWPLVAGLRARGTGSPAQPVVAAHGAPVGDGIPQWRGVTGWGDRESSPTDGCSSRCASVGWQPPMAQSYGLGGGGRGVQPNRWSQLVVRLWGMATPQWRGPTSWGDGHSSPTDGRSSQCACGGWQLPTAQAYGLGGRGVQPSRWLQLIMCLWGMAAPDGASLWAGGRGVRPRRWSQLTVRLWGMAAPNGAGL